MPWNPEDEADDVIGEVVTGRFTIGDYTSGWRAGSNTARLEADFLSTRGVYDKLAAISKKHGFSLKSLLDTIAVETVWQYSPKAKNPNSGAVGLIQFNADNDEVDYKTIQGAKYKIADIAEMGALQQLDLVDKYFEEHHKKGGHPAVTVAWPKAHGMDMDDVISRRGGRVSNSNPNWTDEEGKVTKRSLLAHYGYTE